MNLDAKALLRSLGHNLETEIFTCTECGEKMTRVKGREQTVCYACYLLAKTERMKIDGDGPYKSEDEQMEEDNRRFEARIEQELNHDLYEGRDVEE